MFKLLSRYSLRFTVLAWMLIVSGCAEQADAPGYAGTPKG